MLPPPAPRSRRIATASNDAATAEARAIKAQALTELGERQMNAIARNYYLSSAMYLLRNRPPQ